jgi:hypothetical protein
MAWRLASQGDIRRLAGRLVEYLDARAAATPQPFK